MNSKSNKSAPMLLDVPNKVAEEHRVQIEDGLEGGLDLAEIKARHLMNLRVHLLEDQSLSVSNFVL
jgi:hypothetical protein